MRVVVDYSRVWWDSFADLAPSEDDSGWGFVGRGDMAIRAQPTYSARPYSPLTAVLTAAVGRRVDVDLVVETRQGTGGLPSGPEPAAAFAGTTGLRLWHWDLTVTARSAATRCCCSVQATRRRPSDCARRAGRFAGCGCPDVGTVRPGADGAPGRTVADQLVPVTAGAWCTPWWWRR